nr:hypothetical protein [Tanacetum cinerariifolium]
MSRMQLNSKFVNNMLPEWGVVVQNVQGRLDRGQGNNPQGRGAVGYRGAQNRVGNANPGQARQIKCYNCNGIWHIARNFTQPKRPHNSKYFKDKMLLMQAQENEMAMDEEQLLFLADDGDAFDFDVDEAPMAQTMFMANLLSADLVYDEAGPSYNSDILSEDNAVPGVQSNVSSVPNDAYMVIYNDMYEPYAQFICKTSWNTVVDNSLTAELTTYKEQVELYERWARPKPYYNELNKVAIGYKNPVCLTRTKQVQPALYNGHEIINNNHVSAIVHNTEDTLEIAEITRRKLNDKMKDPKCVKHKMKTEALKEQTTASRPIKALMVYPPNIPVTLVSRVLPTKSQVKIYIFTLIQLFSEFDKTYKKRITPTGLTEGESGFKQTKEFYLKEVISFFKTLKEHFEGIQKDLTKEIKEMKDVFEELEAEVAQNIVDRKHKVFYIATNSEINVARFTEMHVANTIVEARYLELEAELSNLRNKSHNDNHNKLVNRFSNLEVHHLNLQLKYQNLKDSFGNNPPTPAKDTPDFDSVFVIEKNASIPSKKGQLIKQLKKKISYLQETRSEADRTLNFRALDSHITQLTEKVTVLQAQNDLFRAENGKIKQYYKELYDSIKIMRA